MSRILLTMAAIAAFSLQIPQSATATSFVEVALVTVKLTNPAGTSGGTGFPISCTPRPDGTFEILILTAAHVTTPDVEGWDALIASERWLGYITHVENHPTLDASLVVAVSDQPIQYLAIRRDRANIGERVYAVGYPMVGRRTITDGFIGDYNACSTDIYPGNSGGPLVDEDGQCVGILVAGGYHDRGNHYQIISHDAIFVPVVDLLDWLDPHLQP